MTSLLVEASLSWCLVEILVKISLLFAWLGIARALCHLWTAVACQAYRLHLSTFQALAAAGNAMHQIKLSFLLHIALQLCMILSLS